MSEERKSRSASRANRWVKPFADYWSSRIDECDLGVDWSDAAERCWRCGYQRALQRCHIIPKALGGSAEPSNIVALCRECHEEAPDVNDSAEMWRWIKTTSKPFYSTLWALRAGDDCGVDWAKMGRLDIADDAMRAAVERYTDQTVRHLGRNGLSVATIRWVLRKVAEEHGCLMEGTR